jgi:hypothetical protein
MALFLQIMGAIFLGLILLAGIVLAVIAYRIYTLKKAMQAAFSKDGNLAQIVEALGVGAPRKVDARVTDPAAAPNPMPMLEGGESEQDLMEYLVDNHLVTEDDDVFVVTDDTLVEDMAAALEVDDSTPIFQPPDSRTAMSVLRDGPAREAFKTLNAMRSPEDQFELRASIRNSIDVYVAPRRD